MASRATDGARGHIKPVYSGQSATQLPLSLFNKIHPAYICILMATEAAPTQEEKKEKN